MPDSDSEQTPLIQPPQQQLPQPPQNPNEWIFKDLMHILNLLITLAGFMYAIVTKQCPPCPAVGN